MNKSKKTIHAFDLVLLITLSLIHTSYLLQEYLYLGVGFCTAFIVLNGFCKRSLALSKPLVIYLGLFNSIVATLASWGFITYLGINDWQAINLASGFLLLGVGKYLIV